LASEPGAPLVSAIVVAFGKEDVLADCLRLIDRALEAIDGPTELIVVVNGLSDEGRRMAGDGRILVDPGRNLGFAGGVAAGLERARGKWVALVNDDCFVEADAISELLAAGEESEDIGSVAAQIRFAGRDDSLNSAGIDVDELGIARERLLGAPAAAGGRDVTEVFGASAGAALYRRAMLDEVGGLDESFFIYLEDADLAWRARMQGWRAVYAPRAVVDHEHSATFGHRSPRKYFLVGRNRVRMLAKNATGWQLLRRGPQILLYDIGYVAFVAATDRTLAPLHGRLRGLAEWHSYRDCGREQRRRIALARPGGFRGALARNRVYASGRR
jgi:GT2 family glycosyltransferase